MAKPAPKRRQRRTRALIHNDEDCAALQPRPKPWYAPAGAGLQLLVGIHGRKTWSVVYRLDARSQRVTLGGWPEITYAQACAHRDSIKQSVRLHEDPKHRLGYVIVFRDLADKYMELHAKPNKRSWREDDRMLRRHLLPHWGDRRLQDISRRDINLFHKGIAAAGTPILANRVFALFRKICSFGVDMEWLSVNPAASCKQPAANRRRDRALSTDEIRAFWKALPATKMDLRCSLALRLQLVTAQRAGEITGLRWDELDLETGLWSLPGTRAKNKRPHRVPLSKAAITILTAARLGIRKSKKSLEDSPWVFPSRLGDGPMRAPSLSAAIRHNLVKFGIAEFHSHDLRRTAATAMAEDGCFQEVLAKILNHADRSVTGMIYNLSAYDRQKREALDRWAERLEEIVGEKIDEPLRLIK